MSQHKKTNKNLSQAAVVGTTLALIMTMSNEQRSLAFDALKRNTSEDENAKKQQKSNEHAERSAQSLNLKRQARHAPVVQNNHHNSYTTPSRRK